MENKYKRGSEWRKWDLHIHTPASFFWKWWKKLNTMNQDELNLSINDFIQKINDSDVEVFCIMDYWTFDWWIKLIDYKKKNPGSIKKTVFNWMELRVESPTDYRLNIHVILSDRLTEQQLNDFKSELEIRIWSKNKKLSNEALIELANSMDLSKAKKHWYNDPKTLNENELLELWSKVAEVTKDSLKQAFNVIPNETGYILLPYDTSDGLLWLNWEEHPQDDNFFMQTAHIFESRDQRNIDLFNWNKTDENKNFFNNFFKTLWSKAKPCVSWSDAHKFSDYWNNPSNKFTWIKADPTFEWLRQIIYEPEERVYIWEKPEVLNRVKNNKTKYIKKLKIDQVEWYDGKKWIWFKNQEIELNKELVAIIWNKWNWKSAIADILWMLWNTTNYDHFSFLNKERFHKNQISKNFKWTIIWEDNSEDSLVFYEWIPPNSIEKVRYLPQNYFNNLTNELETKKFTETLENVIFNHLEESKKLWQTSFNDLKDYKSKIISSKIENIKSKLAELNTKVVKLERQKQPEELEKINNKILEKENELKVQEDLLKELNEKEIKDPNIDTQIWREKQKKFENIKKINEEIEKENEEIEKEKNNKSQLEINKQNLQSFLWYFESIEKQISDYKDKNKGIYKNLWLDIDKIIDVRIQKSEVEKKLKLVNEAIEKLKYTFIEKSLLNLEQDEAVKKLIEENSLIVKKENLLEQIENIKKDLSKQEKEYQDYIEEIKKIENKIKEIKWENNKYGTLEYYKNIKKYISDKDETWKTNLQKELDYIIENRLNLSLEIYKLKKEIIDLYKEFKKPIDDKVEENEEAQINIDVRFLIKQDFNKNFLNFINQWRRWSFNWKTEWEQLLKEIYNEKNLNEENDIKEILNNFIEYINFDKRKDEKEPLGRNIFDQINELEEFYNYIFWLDYIDTEFELKSWEKSLNELSPWEKWTLLLIFYLMIDEEWIPLIIDQPEDNLDNQSVFSMLSTFIKKAKKKRQIIIVTHNPNLAVWADAEQIIYTKIDKEKWNTFSFESGSIENTIINNHIVNILEWTMQAFDKRKIKYIKQH